MNTINLVIASEPYWASAAISSTAMKQEIAASLASTLAPRNDRSQGSLAMTKKGGTLNSQIWEGFEGLNFARGFYCFGAIKPASNCHHRAIVVAEF